MPRAQIEHVSRPLLVRMKGWPPFLIPVGMVLLIVVGALAPLPVAIPALAIVFLFVAWISYLSWPVITTGGKAMRLFMLLLIIGVGASNAIL